MNEDGFGKGIPTMKLDLHFCYAILCFFLITLSIYLFVLYECNSDNKRNSNNEDLLYIFES